ncbi:MAG: hypothetical protein NTY66_02625 [Candidatus Vogelbacteria bacterium]|nr:hypothetical protein [Candidatus Vogelbacteria bacterium]
MAKIIDSKLDQIKNLYYKDLLSARQIGEKLNVSIDAVYYFLRRHHIERRNLSEQNAATFSHKPLSFCLKKCSCAKDEELKLLGVILYWGEGYKAGETIDFANSDTEMIKAFLNFLRKICGIREDRLRVYMYCYSNQHPVALIKYWSNVTKIPAKQFTKPYVRQDYQLGKEGKMRYGLIHIRYNDKKLWQVIMGWMEEYKTKYA